MSSRPKLRSKAAANGNTATGEGGKVSSKVSADDESLRSPRTNSNGDMGKVVANGKASSENSALQDRPHPLPPQHANDSQSDAASVGSAASHSVGGKATRTTRTRSTRSRTNSTSQRHKDTHYQEEDMSHNSSGTEEDRNTYVDALASTLARLDENAYKTAVLRDANALLENVVFPMSFPWAHPIGPVIRTIPRDIDEMPAIQRIDDPEHEVCSLKHSNFDLAKHLFSFPESEEALDEEEEIRAVARRADNPGVIEMITCAPPLTSLKRTDPSAGSSNAEGKRSVLLRDPIVETSAAPGLDNSLRHDATDKMPPGELSYRIFKEAQEKKRRKLESGMARLKTSLISVRVGSTSSRPSLFDKSESKARLPLLLPAVLPPEFRPVAKGKNAARNQQPGRSKLIWIEKVSSGTSHRVSFSSYLTNEKVESGMHKRPRDVLVGIRVNGKLLTSPKANINLALDATAQDSTSSKRKRDGKAVSLYSTKVVSEALENAFAGFEPRLGTRQCSLDTEEFARRILGSEVNKDRSMGWNLKVTIKGLNVVYVTPRIDCLPSEEGLLHVVCTSPGELQPTNVDDVLQYAAKRKSTPVCTICWRDTSTSGEKVRTCTDCAITVHSNCCMRSDTDLHPKWKCSICAQNTVSSTSQSRQHESNSMPSPIDRASRRSSRVKDGNSPTGGKNGPSCFLCPHRGGSMSVLKRGGRTVWAHDVCRIWCDQSTDSGSGGKTIPVRTGLGLLVCALCGASNQSGDLLDCNGIVKCAATGCSVHFHPMCALFLSKCEERRLESLDCPSKGSNGRGFADKSHRAESELSDSRLEKIIEDDKQLCRQFSLKFAQCSVPGGSPTSVRLSTTTLLPVCFCGIHNPNRDRSLYGLYPGGQQLDAHVMRVPSKKIKK